MEETVERCYGTHSAWACTQCRKNKTTTVSKSWVHKGKYELMATCTCPVCGHKWEEADHRLAVVGLSAEGPNPYGLN